ILRAPKSLLSKAQRELGRGDPGVRGPPLPQKLQTCSILIKKPEREERDFRGQEKKIACKQMKPGYLAGSFVAVSHSSFIQARRGPPGVLAGFSRTLSP